AGDPAGLAEPYDSRYVQGSRPHTLFVTTAIHLCFDPRAATHHQRTDSFRPVHLVRGHTHQVDTVTIRIHRNLAECLDRIGMEQHIALTANTCDLRHRLNDPCLVVGIHHTHDHRVCADGVLQLCEIYHAICMHRNDSDRKTVLLQTLCGIQH